MPVQPNRLPSVKSRKSDAPPSVSAGRSVRNTRPTSSSDQTRATSSAASPKRSLRAARIAPLIAPADAPATISNGCARSRSGASSAMRFNTPA